MKITVCDVCEVKIDDENRFPIPWDVKKGGGSVTLKRSIIAIVQSGSNDFCKYCVFDAIATLDDRKRAG